MSSLGGRDDRPGAHPSRNPSQGSAGSNGRRDLTVAVLVCAAGAGLLLYAGSRTWLVETVVRPAPLGPLSTPRSGTALLAPLAAVSLVVLAGAGALLAVGGWGRRLVGGLIVAGGLTSAGLAGFALGRSGIAVGWVAATVMGGLAAASAGAFAVLRGPAWPRLGARYERPAPPAGAPGPNHRVSGSDQVESGSGGSGEAISREFWDALDRGDDPTKS